MVYFKPWIKVIIIFLFAFLIGLGFYLGFNKETETVKMKNFESSVSSPTSENKLLQVGSKIISVEVADTASEIQKGLSGRDYLDQNSGMYFELDEEKQATFWMKEMKFPIDIVWITDATIVGIVKNAPIPTNNQIPTFTSPTAVTNVLEVKANFCDENRIQVGDKITFK